MALIWKFLAAGPRARWPGPVLGLMVLLALFGPRMLGHARTVLDPNVVDDDSRQYAWTFLAFSDPRLFHDDYIATYYRDCMSTGYRVVSEYAAEHCDYYKFCKIIPYPLLFLSAMGVGLAGAALGGQVCGWSSAALSLSTSTLMGRIAGGTPRAYAFPILAWALAGLLRGRPSWLILASVVGTLFYPVCGVLAGVMLAVYLLSPRWTALAPPKWSWRAKIGLLAATAGACALLIAPNVLGSRKHGKVLTARDIPAYPEAGPGGVYDPGDSVVQASTASLLKDIVPRAFVDAQRPWLNDARRRMAGNSNVSSSAAVLFLFSGLGAALLTTTVGAARLAMTSVAGRRLGAFLLVVFACHFLARAVSPYFYLSERYLRYGIPLLEIVAFPAAVAAIVRCLSSKPIASHAAVLATTLTVILAFGGGGARGSNGYQIRLDTRNKAYACIRDLPPDAIIAGWPEGFIDNVPYFCRRKCLMTGKTHQAFHQSYADEMRRRFRAIVDAYFASGPAPLIALREQFGVTHLVIDRSLFGVSPSHEWDTRFGSSYAGVTHDLDYIRANPPYAIPFNQVCVDARARLGAQEPEVLKQIPTAAIYNEGDLFILDLSKIKN